MTAKQYLRQLTYLNAKIDAEMVELARLRELAEAIPSLVPDHGRGRSRSSANTDRVGRAVARIVDLESNIVDRISRLVELKCEVKERIDSMPDDLLRLVLQMRYVAFKEWDDIADGLGMTTRHTLRVHGYALESFNKIFFRNVT
jgi:DNA-directed RNA polymerase specialized sigma subunit